MFADNAQVMRDIAWVKSTADIVYQPPALTVPADFWQVISPTNGLPFEGGHRIGFYYQWLLAQCLTQNTNYRLVAEELQVERQKRTLGAVDFVVENPKGELEHWEVAIKFYLLHNGEWHGPNAKDTLAKKYRKMTSHQLMLTDTAEYQTQFPGYPIAHRRLLMQGRLYTNPFLTQDPQTHSPEVNPQRVSGYWCWPGQLPQDKHFYALERSQWMTAPNIDELSRYTLPKDLSRAVHLIDETQQHWFVVPADWPSC